MKTNKVKHHSLTLDQMSQIVEMLKRKKSKLMTQLIIVTGLRRRELWQLRKEDLDVTGSQLRIRYSITEFERLVPLPHALSIELAVYVGQVREGGLLFNNADLHALQTDLAQAAKMCNLNYTVTIQTLRYMYASFIGHVHELPYSPLHCSYGKLKPS